MFWRDGRFVIYAGLFKDNEITGIDGIKLENADTDTMIEMIERL